MWVVCESVEGRRFVREESSLLSGGLTIDGIQHFLFEEGLKIRVFVKFRGYEEEVKQYHFREQKKSPDGDKYLDRTVLTPDPMGMEESVAIQAKNKPTAAEWGIDHPETRLADYYGMTPPQEHGMDGSEDFSNHIGANSLTLLSLQYASPQSFGTKDWAPPANPLTYSSPQDQKNEDGWNDSLKSIHDKSQFQERSSVNNVAHGKFKGLNQNTNEDTNSLSSEHSDYVPSKISNHDSDEIYESDPSEASERVTNEKKTATKRQKKRIFCPFCETDVTNFARHVERNHSNEPEVVAFAWRKKKDPERKRQLELLWKRGNFIQSSQGDVRPVRKPLNKRNDDEYTTCTKCFGYFSSSIFYRHAKICHFKEDGTNSKKPRYYHQIAGQNLLLRHLKVDENLRTQVFPRMRPDNVSLVAKSDGLILKFGARYLNSHRAAHFVPVTSRKMRELAKVLIAVKTLTPEVKTFLDVLQPRHFNHIVAATKEIAGFDPKTKIYASPTFAMNISTSIKECCDIAVLEIVNRKEVAGSMTTLEATSEIKSLRDIVDKHWKYEVSSQAGNDLREKSWNKVTLIPVATDLAVLKNYLQQKGSSFALALATNENDSEAFYGMVEVIYCRLLLLNRRRPGELQRLTVDLFERNIDQPRPNASEAFTEVVSPTERILLNKFRRIVLRGKRGRGVPVLFCSEVHEHAKIIVKLRGKFIDPENRLFFVRKNSDEPIRGYQVLAKHVKNSGVKRPEAITCTKLRKHLATMSQLFSMTTTDIEQLATFMGHTVGVHKNVYRLPDDIYQTAKIAKLLVLMEKGDAGQFKNKRLDEIDISPDEEVENYPDDDFDAVADTVLDEAEVLTQQALEIPAPRSSTHRSRPPTTDRGHSLCEDNCSENDVTVPPYNNDRTPSPLLKKKKKRVLVPWTQAQKKAVTSFFASHIRSKRPPKHFEVKQLVEKTGDLFSNRSWQVIKVYVQNMYSKKCNE